MIFELSLLIEMTLHRFQMKWNGGKYEFMRIAFIRLSEHQIQLTKCLKYLEFNGNRIKLLGMVFIVIEKPDKSTKYTYFAFYFCLFAYIVIYVGVLYGCRCNAIEMFVFQ